MRKRTTFRWLDAVPVRATALDARGPGLRGPTAVGALALGATAAGAVAIGRLAIGHATVKRLVIDDLVVRRMRIAEDQPEVGGDPATRARRLIETQSVMTVATADETGSPSVAPVAFVHDEDFNLYWVSSRTATHSENIRRRPAVAIVVFASEPSDGVYVDGTATELEDEAEITRAIALLNRRSQPSKFMVGGLGDVTGEAAWRIYKVTRGETTVRTDATERGQAVTIRTPVTL